MHPTSPYMIYFPTVQRRILAPRGRKLLEKDESSERGRRYLGYDSDETHYDLEQEYDRLKMFYDHKIVTKDLNKLRKAILAGANKIIVVGHGDLPEDDKEHHGMQGMIGAGEGKSVMAPQSALDVAGKMVRYLHPKLGRVDEIWLWICYSHANGVGTQFVEGLGVYKKLIQVYANEGTVGQIDEYVNYGTKCEGSDGFERVPVPLG
jgi:hypothetical protein